MSPPDKIIPLLIGAIERVQRFDDYVDFTGYESPRKATGNTAVAELLRTLAGAGPRGLDAVRMLRRRPDVKERFSAAAIALMDAVDSKVAAPGHCCSGGTNSEVCESINLDRDALTHLWDIELQDQDGNRASCRYFFEDRVSLMSFFYTRCMNPNKCSSTVSKLASIGRRIAEEGKVGNVVVAGITYDPDFDSPERLHRYGVDRGMTFGDHCRLLRTTGPFEALRQPLDLQVGFGSSTVNRHALDVLVVDRTGRITYAITRRLWAEAEVYERLMAAATSA
jgi:protein SCO1/2